MARPRLTPEENELFKKFLMPEAPPAPAPSSFDVNESSSPSAMKGMMPKMETPQPFALTMDDITKPPLTDRLLNPPEPTPQDTLPVVPKAETAAKAPAVDEDAEFLKTFLADAGKPMPEPEDNPLKVVGQALSGFADAQMAGAGRDSNFLERTIKVQDTQDAKAKELAAAKEMSDPNSAKSKSYQALMKEMFPGMDVSKLSAAQAEKVMGPLGQIVEKREGRKTAEENRRLQRETLQAERDRRFGERQDKIGVDLVNKFNQDPGVRKIEATIDAANTIDELASSGNPIAAGAIPTYMARASGEVGALTEADKAPFGGSRAILSRLDAAFTQAASGGMTPENKAFVKNLAATMQKRAAANKDRRAKEWADQYSQVTPMGSQEIYAALRPGRAASGSGVPADVASGAAAELAKRRSGQR